MSARAFQHDGCIATLRLPNDCPLIRAIVLKDVAPEHVDGVAFIAGAARILDVVGLPDRDGRRYRAGELLCCTGADGSCNEMRIEVGPMPGHGLDVLETAIDMVVTFVEGVPDQRLLRASVEFW